MSISHIVGGEPRENSHPADQEQLVMRGNLGTEDERKVTLFLSRRMLTFNIRPLLKKG